MRLTEEELRRLVSGAAFLASGGGGSLKIAERMIPKIIAGPHEVEIVPVEELPAEALGIVVADMGAPDAMFHDAAFDAPLAAVEAVERWLGRRCGFCLPVEIGAVNALAPLMTAARTGLPVADADGAGRAIPQLEMTSYAQAGIPAGPAALAGGSRQPGGVRALLDVNAASEMEKLARLIVASPAFGEIAGLACYPMDARQAKSAAIAGTLLLAIQVGAVIETHRADAVSALLAMPALAPAYLLARGALVRHTVRTQAGFDLGLLELRTDGGEIVRVHYENESLLAEREDGRSLAMAPDSICCIAEDEGMPRTNADLPQGESLDGPRLAFIGLRAREPLRAPKVVRAFLDVLRRFGYEGGYVPIERLHGEARG